MDTRTNFSLFFFIRIEHTKLLQLLTNLSTIPRTKYDWFREKQLREDSYYCPLPRDAVWLRLWVRTLRGSFELWKVFRTIYNTKRICYVVFELPYLPSGLMALLFLKFKVAQGLVKAQCVTTEKRKEIIIIYQWIIIIKKYLQFSIKSVVVFSFVITKGKQSSQFIKINDRLE